MKTRYSILIICLLALFATGCKKESNSRIRIFAENMRGDSKIIVDYEEDEDGNRSFTSSWVAGEYISIGGINYEINEDDEGFYIQCDYLQGTAIYPGSGDEYNDIEVNGTEVVLKRLTVNFISDWGYVSETQHKVVFPMVAVPSNDQLLFKHLTGGLMLTLQATDHTVDVASVKIVAQGTAPFTNLGENGFTARWEVQGPTLPHGEVGETTGDYNAAYACEMNVDFTKTDNGTGVTTSGVSIFGDYYYQESLSFCVPITISSFSSITVTGYSSTGAQLFHVTKDLTSSPITILRNTMYTVPPIEIQ